MTLTIRARFPRARYEATVDRGVPEWPPHPARLFCAMTASARSASDDECLRWMEALPAPLVIADPRPLDTFEDARYVVLNTLPKAGKGKNQNHPGRTTGGWTRTTVTLPREDVWFSWPDAHPDDRLTTIAALLARVPYLGRSSAPVLLDCSSAAPEAPTGWWEPTTDTSTTQVDVRVPYQGYLDELRTIHAAFEAGGRQRAWTSARSVAYAYRSAKEPTETEPIAAGWADMIVLGFDSAVQLSGSVLPRVTQALRRTMLARTQEVLGAGATLPEALHGHYAKDRPVPPGQSQVGVIALPDVGHRHADGHLLGVAVLLPRKELLNGDDRRAVLRAVQGLIEGGLNVPHAGRLTLRHEPMRRRPAALTTRRWQRASTRWMSATPLVLDRHPKRRAGDLGETDRWERAVSETITRLGLPEPVDVAVSNRPLQRGVCRVDPRELPQDRRHYPPMVHAELLFDRPVYGPMVAGRMRYLGLGLFNPTGEDERS